MKMRVIIASVIFLFLMVSTVSAEIIFDQQPGEVYNLGDNFPVFVTLKPNVDVTGNFDMNLICNGQEVNFYKNPVIISAGEEKKIEAALILRKDFIGNLTGNCKIKAILGGDTAPTNQFKVSDMVEIILRTGKTEFNPGENILIEGDASKENNKGVNGFVDLAVMGENSANQTYKGTVNNGYFAINFAFPKETKAGLYSMMLNAYEKDSNGEITNKGVAISSITIKQVPTSLEIIFNEQEVLPGTNMEVKAVLHDQTGESIPSKAIITVKDKNNKIYEQTEMPTDEFLEFLTANNQPPSEWTVVAVSNKLTSHSMFKVIAKESIKTEVINKTLIIYNDGNVPYNKTLLVKIGEESLNLNVYLLVDEVKKYILSAPDGEYSVEIIEDGETALISGGVTLTGKAVDIREFNSAGFKSYYLAWIFVILILGFVAFIIFRRGYRRSFFGYIPFRRKKADKVISKKSFLPHPRNAAELSLSLRGDRQNTSMVCLKLKNFDEIQNSDGNADETIKNIIGAAENEKGYVYENNDNLFFIFAPLNTRTFHNEKTSMKFAKNAEEILTEHNKMFKQKIEFGISVDYGSVIAKKEGDEMRFLSFGDLIQRMKKIASVAENEVLLSEKMKEKLATEIKTERHVKSGMNVYSVKEVRDREKHKKLAEDVMKRINKKD
ncbi:MAG: hypothetical protein ABIH49_02015 [archaeon]